MISSNRRCIFVHIPKTAGSSIEKTIWPKKREEKHLWMGFVDKYHNKYQTGGLQHLLASQIRTEVGTEIFEEYFKFSIIRNPWDKVVSQFSYMHKRPDLREFCGLKKDACLKQYLEAIQKIQHVQWLPQFEFLYDDQNNLLVDYVGRFESLNKDILVVFNRLGITSELPHTNKSERVHYREYYDKESSEIVAEMYKKDLELFDYQF